MSILFRAVSMTPINITGNQESFLLQACLVASRIIRTPPTLSFFSQRLQLLDDSCKHKSFGYKVVKLSYSNIVHIESVTPLCIVVELTKLGQIRRAGGVRIILLTGSVCLIGL